MKKTLIIGLLLLCVLALASCNGQTNTTPTPTTGIKTETEATQTTDDKLTPLPPETDNLSTPDSTPTHSPDNTPTPTPTPTPTTPPEPQNKYDNYTVTDFDKTVDSESSDEVDYHKYNKGNMILGSLAVVSKEYGYNSKYTSELVKIREERNGTIDVSSWDIQCTKEVLAAIDALNESYKMAFPDSTKSLMVSAGFSKSTELGSYAYSSEHTTGYMLTIKLWDGEYTYTFDQNTLKTERQWMLDNCYKFGFVQRYSSSKEETTGVASTYSEYRYVGIPHSYYMNEYSYCLEEYTDKLKSYSFDSPLKYTDPTGDEWEIYYVACNNEGTTDIPVKKNTSFTISGDNRGGFIVTIKSRNVETIEYSALINAINKLKGYNELSYKINQTVVISEEDFNTTVIEAWVKDDSFKVINIPGSTYVYKDSILYCIDSEGNTISSEYAIDTAFSKYCPKGVGHDMVASVTEECLYLATVSSSGGVYTYSMFLTDGEIIDSLCKNYFNRAGAISNITLTYKVQNSTLIGYHFEGTAKDGTRYVVDFEFDTASPVIIEAPAANQ